MAWFKKKEKIPQLPSAPTLPEIPVLNAPEETIPVPPSQDQEIIKSTMVSSEKKEVISEPKSMEFMQEGSMIPSIEEYQVPQETTTRVKTTTTKAFLPPPRASKEPVFIKIDKYESAMKDLDDIKKGLRDIEATLEKVRDAKLREDLEISGWSQEIANIKAKINSIDSRIFNQI